MLKSFLAKERARSLENLKLQHPERFVFTKGMMVRLIGEQKKRYGGKPLKVIKVERVDYEEEREHARDHNEEYEKPAHPQYVTIMTPEGKQTFSGAWLVPA